MVLAGKISSPWRQRLGARQSKRPVYLRGDMELWLLQINAEVRFQLSHSVE